MKGDTNEAGAIDSDALAAKIIDGVVGELAKRNAVVEPETPSASSSPTERDYNVAREALAATRLFGSDAIRFAFLINAGALTAILAYLGSGNAPGKYLAGAIVAFAVGAIFAFGAALFAYRAQSELADRYNRWKAGEDFPKAKSSSIAFWLLCVCAGAAATGTILSFLELQNAAGKSKTILELKILRP